MQRSDDLAGMTMGILRGGWVVVVGAGADGVWRMGVEVDMCDSGTNGKGQSINQNDEWDEEFFLGGW